MYENVNILPNSVTTELIGLIDSFQKGKRKTTQGLPINFLANIIVSYLQYFQIKISKILVLFWEHYIGLIVQWVIFCQTKYL